jgi:hypothetical protein
MTCCERDSAGSHAPRSNNTKTKADEITFRLTFRSLVSIFRYGQRILYFLFLGNYRKFSIIGKISDFHPQQWTIVRLRPRSRAFLSHPKLAILLTYREANFSTRIAYSLIILTCYSLL